MRRGVEGGEVLRRGVEGKGGEVLRRGVEGGVVRRVEGGG